jgi:perosamine synthetase
MSFFVSVYPSLRPHMLFRRTAADEVTFPFGRPALRYFYLARNGISFLARQWHLEDQEVLFPAYFHGVELEALLAAGVQPRFYPVHRSMRVDVDDVCSLISPRTRAVYLIHYLGFPGPVEPLAEICRARGLLLIEDCALALLSQLGDRPLGSFGDAAIFCLYKTLPVPNGGVLFTAEDRVSSGKPALRRPSVPSTLACTACAFWRRLRFQHNGGPPTLLGMVRRSARSVSRKIGVAKIGTDHFDLSHADLAMSRVCHWILAGQDFHSIVERRRRNYSHLLKRLRSVCPPVFEELPRGVCPLFYPLQTHHKPALLERLFDGGIEAVNFWSQTPSIVPKGMFPEVDELRRTILELPCHQDLTVEAVDRIAAEVCAALAGI